MVLGHAHIVDRQLAPVREREHVGADGEGGALRLDHAHARRGSGRRGSGGEYGQNDRGDEREPLHRPAVPTAALSSGSFPWKSPSGSATPRFSNFSRNVGRSPVDRRPPTIVPSRVTSSIWYLNSSWSVM